MPKSTSLSNNLAGGDTGAQLGGHRAGDGALLKRRGGLLGASRLAQIHRAFEPVPAQENPRQVIRNAAEADHAQGFAAQIFDAD